MRPVQVRSGLTIDHPAIACSLEMQSSVAICTGAGDRDMKNTPVPVEPPMVIDAACKNWNTTRSMATMPHMERPWMR